jgi:hypothetical protein
MIRGLQLAGQNPTRTAFISKLRAEPAYTGGGLIPPVNLTGFATKAMFPAQTCADYVQFKGGKFKTVKKNSCGKLFAYTR